MNQILRKILLLAILFTTTLSSSAYDFKVNGIYYNITSDSTVEVTYSSSYQGNITIPKTVVNAGTTYQVTKIGTLAFQAQKLTSVTLPNTLKEIGYNAFDGCTGLKTMTIPNSVEIIKSSAFEDCTALESVTIPNSVTEIGYSAFKNCSSLKEVYLPNSIEKIDQETFYGCSSLNTIYIPKSVTKIWHKAFLSCSNLDVIYIDDIESWCNIDFYDVNATPMYSAKAPHLCIIDKKTNKSVRRVPALPITYLGEIIDLEIPSTVTEIKQYAFYNCKNIRSVNLSNVEDIRRSAFQYCTGLKIVTVSDKLSGSYDNSFLGCTGLESVNIMDLGSWCKVYFSTKDSNPLKYARNLSLNDEPIIGLTSPNDVVQIKQYAFINCQNIKNADLRNVSFISESAFEDCTGLKTISFSDKLKKSYKDSFSGCTGLEAVFIKSVDSWCGVDFENERSNPISYAHTLKYLDETRVKDVFLEKGGTINDYVFYGCTSIESLTLPASLSSIGGYAFYGCSNLKTLYYNPSKCATIGLSAFKGTQIEKVVFGNIVAIVPDGLLCDCGYLSELVFPESVMEIGNNVWPKNKLKKISILGPTKVGSNDFSGVDLTLNNDCNVSLPRGEFFDCSSSTTYTTATVTVSPKSNLHVVDSAGNPTDLKCTSGLSENHWSWDGKEMKFWGLSPDRALSVYAFHYYIYGDFGTNRLSCSFKDEKYADLIKVTAEWDSGDYPITEAYWWDFYYYKTTISKTKTATLSYEEYKQTPEVRFYLSGNDPDYLSYSNSYDYTVSFPSVEISNESAQATSYTSARLSAEMNVSTGSVAGIEWRRNDAPENVKSNRVEAPVVGGRLMGELRGLRDDVYYKFRPFYNRDGVEFYGEWTGFYTGDAGVYFDPEVGTLPAIVGQTTVTMSGYVVAGSDNVTDRGFEYRLDSPASRAGDWQRISSTGTYMTSTAEGLTPATTYVYRAYAEASGKTYYGAEVSFTTEDTSGIEDVVAVDADGDGLAVALRENPVVDRPAVRVDAAGAETAECRIIGMNGNLVYSGTVAVTGDFETLEVSLGRGFYILYVSAGGHTKAVKMIVR